jgi:1-acyl-sn-glycerol-3-phosphate acyltransferase
MQIGAILHTIAARFLLFIFMCVVIIPVGIMMLLPPRIRFTNKLLYKILYYFNWAALKATLVPIRYKGLEHIPAHQPVIFAANHQSSMDIPLMGVLPGGKPNIWLARSELLKTWLLRFIIERLTVVVNVNSQASAMGSVRMLVKLVKDTDIDIMIFPEGQRFTDGDVHEFFGGFVTLAKLLKRPVVPVRIFGANKVYPPETFLVNYYPVTVVVGEPFVLQENESENDFKQRVYNWFVAQTEA